MMAEILAPAGSFEALKTAVINGADAVYIGLSKFSARAKAENFNNDVLLQALNYAHLYGVKVYIAINTLVKNDLFAKRDHPQFYTPARKWGYTTLRAQL